MMRHVWLSPWTQDARLVEVDDEHRLLNALELIVAEATKLDRMDVLK